MSMISSQRDTLLVMADALEEEYPSFAREVRRAADTIWELRNKLAGTVDQSERIAELKDENARLRSCLSDDAENARQIMGENAKLRELCKDIWNDACRFEGFWDYVHDDGTIYREDELPHYQERMRECGIEVK